MSNTCRLVYRSLAAAEAVSNESLAKLEKTAADNNRSRAINGLLVLAGNVFIQVLEGSAEKLTALFADIMADTRHRKVELIAFESQVPAQFDDWNMRLVDMHDLPGPIRQQMLEKYGQSHEQIKVPKTLPAVYAFLMDAKHICLSSPWKNPPVEKDMDDNSSTA